MGVAFAPYQWLRGGVIVVGATGASYTLSQADVGQAITVAASYTDQQGTSERVTSAATAEVANVNDTPVATAASASAIEGGTAVSGQLISSDEDPGDPLTFALTTPIAGLTLSTSGNWSFDPSNLAYNYLAAGQSVSVLANYTVQDLAGASSASSLTILLTGTNDAPTARPDVTSVVEDGFVTGNLITGVTTPTGILDNVADSDPDTTDSLTITSVAGQAAGTSIQGRYGTLIIQANGTYSYSADADVLDAYKSGVTGLEDIFSYTISDGQGGTATSSLTVSVSTVADVITQTANNGKSTLVGGVGDDLLTGNNGADTLTGGAGADQLYGASGSDFLDGGAGFDFLSGGAGDDTLIGGAGADILFGGKGNDLMTGGTEADIFYFENSGKSTGADTITDFQVGVDRLFLEAGLGVSAIQSSGDSTTVTLSNGSSIYLLGVSGFADASLFLTNQLPEWTNNDWLV